MKMFRSILQQQVVGHYRRKQVNLDFTIEALKCHKDDEHKFTGLDTEEVPPFACSFNKSLLRGNMLAVADEDGGICLFDLRKKCSESMLKGWVAHSNAIFDIAWVDNEPKLVTASGDQTAQLWDIQHGTRLGLFRGHSSSLKSVDFQEESQFVFATGARDGNIMIWDVRCNKRNGYYQPVNTIRNCHSTLSHGTAQGTKKKRKRSPSFVSQDSQQSVTSVKYQDMNTIVSAGAVDGNIKVWDLRKNYSNIRTEPIPYHVFPYPGSGTRKHGFSSLAFDSNKSRLFANCTNDIIYMYDCMSFKRSSPLGSFQGHSNTTFYVKSAISPDDQFLLSGSGDCDAYIWNINKPNAAPFHLVGHDGEVTSVAWCPQDQAKIATCSDDNNLKVWRVNFDKDQDKSQFVGWCERKVCPTIKPKTNTENVSTCKIRTPSTSPSRSHNSSTSSSPLSLSPNPSKCSSPQQVLQSWLKSNTSKRPRESDSAANSTKRYCLEPRSELRDAIKKLDINEELDINSCRSTSNSPEVISQVSNKDTREIVVESIEHEENKENIQVGEAKTKQDQPQLTKGLYIKHLQLDKENERLKTTSSAENTDLCLNCHHKQFNEDKTLNCIGEKSQSVIHGERLTGITNKLDEKKEKTSSKPTSPLKSEPSSPDKFAAVLKNMRCIKDYFKPILKSGEDSPSNDCER